MAEPRTQNAMSAEDWPGEQLGPEESVNDSFSTIREQALGTGVRVKGALYLELACVTLTHKTRRWTVGHQVSRTKALVKYSHETCSRNSTACR
jgi:hypothetical protein